PIRRCVSAWSARRFPPDRQGPSIFPARKSAPHGEIHMARTLFGTGDAGTPKRWSTKALSEITKKSYFISRMAGSEDQLLPVVLRSDLESGPGDEVTVYLVAKIQGLPIQGNEKAEGR